MAERRPDSRDQVAGLVAAVRGTVQAGTRSVLYDWMFQRHDALTEGFGTQRVKWAPAARYLAGLGLVDGTGKAPTAETARITWWRVRKDVAEARARGIEPPAIPAEAVPASRSFPVPAPVQAVEAGVPPPSPEPARPRPKFAFQPARALGSVSAAPSTPAPPSTPAQPAGGADQQVSKLFEHMDARRHRVPRIVE